jgi:hypothetical protein
MPKVFKTSKDSPDPVELVGTGVAGSYGRGGVLVEAAAERYAELQSAGGVPLKGKELDNAAEEFAEARGLEVVNVSKKDLESLPQEWGVPPNPVPAGSAAEEEYDRVFGADGEAPENVDAAEAEAGGGTDGAAGSGQKAEG